MVNWPKQTNFRRMNKCGAELLTRSRLPQLLWKTSDNKECAIATSTFWHHLHYIRVVIGSESGLCPKPVSAMTVMSTVDADGGQTDTEGRVTLVSQVSLPQEKTLVE